MVFFSAQAVVLPISAVMLLFPNIFMLNAFSSNFGVFVDGFQPRTRTLRQLSPTRHTSIHHSPQWALFSGPLDPAQCDEGSGQEAPSNGPTISSSSPSNSETTSRHRRQVLGQMTATTMAAWTAATTATKTPSGLYLPRRESAGLDLGPSVAVANAAERTSKIVVPQVQLGKGSLYVSRTIQGYWQLAGGHGRYKGTYRNILWYLSLSFNECISFNSKIPPQSFPGAFRIGCLGEYEGPLECRY